MSAQQNESTRLLCASAFLAGTAFREKILNRLHELHQAAAPELGVDIKLVAQVCKFADRRALYYTMGFTSFLIAAAIIQATILEDVALTLYLVLAFLAGILVFIKVYGERYTLLRPFLRQNFDPVRVAQKYPDSFSSSNGDSVAQPDQNLIVYSGFLPFVGAGIDFGGWSFALSTIKPAEEMGASKKPEPFTLSELYFEIGQGLDALGINQMSSDDFYFVSGTDIRNDPEILPFEYGRPAQRLKPETAALYKEDSDPRIRHYRWIRVEDWGGELAMSMFLRCTVRGSNLFVEMKKFLLIPLDSKYRGVDKIGPPTVSAILLWFIGAQILGPFYVLFSALYLIGRSMKKLTHVFGSKDRAIRRQIRTNPLFNYGVDQSLRTMFSGKEYRHYFQKLDTDFYGKVLERQMLDSIVSFLDERNIDTSELRERKNTILNSGIILQGGDVKAESLAVGTGAKAVKAGLSNLAKAAKGPES